MRKLLTLITLFANYSIIWAQCAMCKAGAEQSLERGATDASTLNNGIFLLMLMPITLIISFIVWYRKKNREKK